MDHPSERAIEARRRASEWTRISLLSDGQKTSAEQAERKRAEAWSSGHRDHGGVHNNDTDITNSSTYTPSNSGVGRGHGFSMALDSSDSSQISHDSDNDLETDYNND
jgi:hypothetical protein